MGTSLRCSLGDDLSASSASPRGHGSAPSVPTLRGRFRGFLTIHRPLDHGTKALAQGPDLRNLPDALWIIPLFRRVLQTARSATRIYCRSHYDGADPIHPNDPDRHWRHCLGSAQESLDRGRLSNHVYRTPVRARRLPWRLCDRVPACCPSPPPTSRLTIGQTR